jgi:hypothetical protein
LRWQIEIAIKRLKSLLGLGALPAKNPALARAWLAAKLILALLAEAEAHVLRRALSPQAPGPPHPAVLASSPRRRTPSRQRRARPATTAKLVKAGR